MSATRSWPPTTRTWWTSYCRRCRMSKMPSTKLRWEGRLRCRRCIPWRCLGNRSHRLPECSTRIWFRCWKGFWVSTMRRVPLLRLTRTRTLRTGATRDPRPWTIVFFSQIQGGLTRILISSTPICSMLRSVQSFNLVLVVLVYSLFVQMFVLFWFEICLFICKVREIRTH